MAFKRSGRASVIVVTDPTRSTRIGPTTNPLELAVD